MKLLSVRVGVAVIAALAPALTVSTPVQADPPRQATAAVADGRPTAAEPSMGEADSDVDPHAAAAGVTLALATGGRRVKVVVEAHTDLPRTQVVVHRTRRGADPGSGAPTVVSRAWLPQTRQVAPPTSP